MATVYNIGRVSNSGSFDYTTTRPGMYALVFDNAFSFSSYKFVSAAHAVAGTSYTKCFSIAPGTNQTFPFDLSTGQRLVGQFNVTGGSGNDVNFYIAGLTCSQTVYFSFTPVNGGSADGYATVQFLVDGQSFGDNRYFVTQGQNLPENGSVVLSDCVGHVYDIVVSQTEKAQAVGSRSSSNRNLDSVCVWGCRSRRTSVAEDDSREVYEPLYTELVKNRELILSSKGGTDSDVSEE